jgi:flagellar basal body-associated protein FliL
MKTRLVSAAILTLALSAEGARAADSAPAAPSEASSNAQSEQQILLDTLRANRKAFVAVNLQLSPEEEKGFWPVYDRYQKELNGIQDRVVAIVDDYGKSFRDLSNDKGIQLVQDFLSAEADRVQVRRTYLPEFSKVLPGRTVARFYQLENKMDALLRFEMVKTIPVIDEKPAPAR